MVWAETHTSQVTGRASWRRWLFCLEFKGDNLFGEGGFQKVREKGMGNQAGARGKDSILVSFCGWNTILCPKVTLWEVYFIYLTGCRSVVE